MWSQKLQIIPVKGTKDKLEWLSGAFEALVNPKFWK